MFVARKNNAPSLLLIVEGSFLSGVSILQKSKIKKIAIKITYVALILKVIGDLIKLIKALFDKIVNYFIKDAFFTWELSFSVDFWSILFLTCLYPVSELKC